MDRSSPVSAASPADSLSSGPSTPGTGPASPGTGSTGRCNSQFIIYLQNTDTTL